MTKARHMRPPMHNALVLRNLREYCNKYSATESVGVSATTFTQCAGKATEFGEITHGNRHYAVQGHSRSPILVPIESPYATSY